MPSHKYGGGAGNEEGGREAINVGCRHAVGDKSKTGRGEAGKGLMCAKRGQSQFPVRSVENLSREHCEGDFPSSFREWIRRFYDVFRQKILHG
jgi:hypothetical protein